MNTIRPMLLLLLLLPLPATGEQTTETEKGIAPPEEPLSLSRYPSRIDEYREKMQKYIERKKRICRGEFSKIILAEQAGEEGERKLSPDEKKLCFEELKKKQKDFINNMYNLRKKYLISLHKNRLKQLEEDKTTLLKSLDQKPSKKSKKRRRRKR